LVEESRVLSRIGPDVARSEHRQELDEGMKERWEAAEIRLRADLAVPNADDLGLGPELLHLLVRMGKLVRVSDDLVFLPEQVDDIERHLQDLGSGFTVAEFRDHTGLSRKYAIPLLEWSDKKGLTFRRGDQRHLR
jgi:selenocysteine-specific elongation factor